MQKPNLPAVKDDSSKSNFSLVGIGVGILAYFLTMKYGPALYAKVSEPSKQ